MTSHPGVRFRHARLSAFIREHTEQIFPRSRLVPLPPSVPFSIANDVARRL